MDNQDLPRFTHIFMGICEIYQRNATEIFIELYWRALQHFELSAVEAAFNAHTRDPDHGNRMPLPSDIVRLLEGNSYTQASQAWSKLANAIKHIGAWESVVFDDAIIHMVVEEMGGWVALCHMKEKDSSYRSHEFMKRYGSYILHKPTRYPSHLSGLIEQHNQQKGFAHQKLLLIGNKSSALKILDTGKETKSIQHQVYQLLKIPNQLEQTHEKSEK